MTYVTDVGKRALREHWKDYFLPNRWVWREGIVPFCPLPLPKWDRCVIEHRRQSFNDISDLIADYDIIAMDREFTIQCGAEHLRDEKFGAVLQVLTQHDRGDILSVSTVEDFFEIGKLYNTASPDDFYNIAIPVNKLVGFKGYEGMYLLRYMKGGLKIFKYTPERPMEDRFEEQTGLFWNPDKDTAKTLAEKVDTQYEKPEPITLKAVIDYNIWSGRAKKKPKVLMVGDMIGADVSTAKFYNEQYGTEEAKVSSCQVKSYGLWLGFRKFKLLAFTRFFDRAIGNWFSIMTDPQAYTLSWDSHLRYAKNSHSRPSP